MRPSRRAPDELRPVSLERGVVKYAEGSCMVKFGDTHVLVTATLEERLPPWLKGQGRGWVTAEYGMLPRATLERTRREAAAGKQGGRTVEIQRLIGRSLRAAIDLEALGERQITVDCDVILDHLATGQHLARLHPGEAVMQRHPGAGDRGGARAAIGLDHVAVDRDLPLAELLQVDHGAQAAADQPLDFDRAATLLAGRCLAAGTLRRRPWQHPIFGRDPASRLPFEPGRQLVFQGGGHQHMGVAEFHETRAFGVFHHAAFERDGTQLIGLSAAGPHVGSFRAAESSRIVERF